MGIEDEGRQTQRKRRNPEVDDMRDKYRQCHEEQHDQCAHPQVNARTGEAREQRAEVDSRSCESTSRGDVTSTTIVKVRQNRVALDLGGKYLEEGGQRRELLGQTEDSTSSSTFNEF